MKIPIYSYYCFGCERLAKGFKKSDNNNYSSSNSDHGVAENNTNSNNG